ncbi:hypothetical protein NP233_g7154 [Leucocoprinus birnbaumii]|uniref:DUF6533 domain-containing protein n=1 Tax=Leucocoprinus birnbaumii TaxID=56174 RepID=A0AAD5VPS8_9AGAR|nr:hypothetical protein NP233_g7154 [Leucocoprinus birnbaumii]
MSTLTDQWGLTLDDYTADYIATQSNNSMNTVAVTLLAYDTLHLLPKEIRYIYCGSWSRMRILYITIRLSVWFYLIMMLYTQGNNFLSESWYAILINANISLYKSLGTVIIPIVIKVLLVIRLRAAWEYNRTVTVVLYIFSAAEALIYAVNATFTIIRAASTVLETVLTIVGFAVSYRETKALASTFGKRISHMKTFTPVLFVFYRDGMFLFLPILIHSAIQILTIFHLLPSTPAAARFSSITWNVWIAVAYSMAGARLILNVREAGCKVEESLITGPGHSIQFLHVTDCNDEESLSNAEDTSNTVYVMPGFGKIDGRV